MKFYFSGSVTVPDDVSKADVEKWLSFELGLTAELSMQNAMANTDLITHGVDTLEVRYSK